MSILIDNILLKELCYIQNRKMCLSETISYQYFGFFCVAWGSFYSKNILYIITYRQKNP